MRVAIVTAAALGLVASPAWADCPVKDGKPQVFVKAKTPIRRGPGLNYQVSSFLERGRCMPFSEVSMDKRWVLVDVGEVFGWVPLGRLSSDSQGKAAEVAPPDASIGSGQRRGQARVVEQTLLLDAPDPNAAPRRVLPVDLMVVPLAATKDGNWAQVRDERGQTGWVLVSVLRGDALADLPVDELTPSAPVTAAPGPTIIRVRPGRSGIGVAVTAAVYTGAAVPIMSLDTDAPNARRRYDVSALAPATGIELEFDDLGPTSLRLGYQISFLTGIEADGELAAGGNTHDLYLQAGLPIELGPVTLVPEVGYRFMQFDFDSVLSDQPLNVTFLSTTTHVAIAGARATYFPVKEWMLEADGGALLGHTVEGPRNLGDGGFTLGGYGRVGVQTFLNDIMGVGLRYQVDYRRASYSGDSQLDPGITEGTLSGFSQGVWVGLSFLLAG